MKSLYNNPLVLALACIAVLPALTRADDRPTISRVDVYVSGALVVSDLHCGNLFSEQVVGTVESGLPAVVEVLYQVVDRQSKLVRRGIHSYELRHDVWEDVYLVNRGDSTLTFSSFEGMGSVIERLQRIAVVALGDITAEAEYAVEFSISVHPLRGSEQEKIVGWVDETVRGKSNRAWHEQLLNVDDLIHRFFSRDKDKAYRSEWYRTPFFKPTLLPRIDRPGPVSNSREGGGV